MTQEEKQLLLIDLCGRLPYGVKVRIEGDYFYDEREPYDTTLKSEVLGHLIADAYSAKPYLRPMSSMTTEEEYEYHQCKNIDYFEIYEMGHAKMLETTVLYFSRAIDWLNKKGFDYRGLIPMGLALEAKEEMYKIK